MTLRTFCLFSALALAASACGDGGGGDADTVELELVFSGLSQLGGDFVYEGWLITADGPVSTGRFVVDAAGAPDQTLFDVDATVAAEATAFVLTIEPGAGDLPEPSDTHLLAGALNAGVASLSISHEAALGDDFSTAAGQYVLAAPSAGEGGNFRNGIWWVIPGDPRVQGLVLPTLPAGWTYEGWVANEDGPISTGRFVDLAAEDSDGKGPNAGPEDGPPFPGQDFVNPPTDLTTGYMAVISIEPEPDDSPAPFVLKPLVDTIEELEPPDTQPMSNNAAATSPTGTASLSL